MREDRHKYIDVALADGGVLRVEPVTAHIFRIRLRQDGHFRDPSLIRYGIIRSNWEPVEFSVKDEDHHLTIRTGGAYLSISKNDGRLSLRDTEGQPLLQEVESPRSSMESGFNVEFQLRDDEKLYGLGDETRDRVQKRGHRAQMWVKNVACYVPIPYLMSTGGWGIFLNTTWRSALLP